MVRPRVPDDGAALALRGLLVLAGALVVLATAYLVLEVAPGSLDPEPGARSTVTERVDYWSPEQGREHFLRPRTDSFRSTGEGIELVRRLEGPHSPRGDEFRIGVGDDWRLADEPAAHASFPPTPLWQAPPEIVYVGVPWETSDGVRVDLFDDFHRLGEVERGDLTLVEYKAREPNQFLVDGDDVWFRSAERTALVEPVSGTVVDYRDEETLWHASLEGPDLLHEVRPPRENREKVWQAVVEPTPSGEQALAERAEANREEQWRGTLARGLPALLLAEALMAAGMLGRPRRLLGAGSSD